MISFQTAYYYSSLLHMNYFYYKTSQIFYIYNIYSVYCVLLYVKKTSATHHICELFFWASECHLLYVH